MTSTYRPSQHTRYSLRPDPMAVLIRRCVQAHRVHKELGETDAALSYLELARFLLDWRIAGERAGR